MFVTDGPFQSTLLFSGFIQSCYLIQRIYANPSIFLSKSRFSVLVNERMIGFISDYMLAYILTYAGPDITDFMDVLLITSPRLIKSPTQSIILSFAKTENLDLDKKIEGLAYIHK